MPWGDIGDCAVLAAHVALIAPSAAHPKGAILYGAGYGSGVEASERVAHWRRRIVAACKRAPLLLMRERTQPRTEEAETCPYAETSLT